MAAANSIVVVQDESLIDEMRTALQGDRERAAARRHTPGPADGPPSEHAPAPAPAAVPAAPAAALPPRGLLARLARRRRRS